MSPIRKALVVPALLSTGLVACTRVAPPLENVAYTEFVPSAGQGQVVVVLSGAFGPQAYAFFPAELVKLGYYAVLFRGTDFGSQATGARDNLQQVILRAQHSPHATPGKVAVIGFSAGGGDALAYATSMSDLVSVVVAYYPATSGIPDKADVIRRWEVPSLVFAGDADNNNGCCMIDTIRTMVASARDRGAPVELVVYHGAGHDFILGGHFLKKDAADDAWQRTLAALREHFGVQEPARSAAAQ
jgi:dipeptidyl aminopeptidase/acylaminoacyl peptidase